MKYFSPRFTGIEHDIDLIVSIHFIKSFMYNLRGRKILTQACTPSFNCTKEYHFLSSDSLSGVIEVSDIFANCQRSNASLLFKFVFILERKERKKDIPYKRASKGHRVLCGYAAL
jgi:hypothetical protein